MGSEWREVGLSDLGQVARGRSKHRPRYAEHLYGGQYPFIQTGDVKASGGRITSHSQTYSEAGLAQSRLWPAGTLCITIAANIAETGILSYPACFPDSVIGFIADPAKCDVRFIEYSFRQLKKRLQHEAIGSVQDNINLATFERLKFPIPDLTEQKRIAHILGALDDKIELNRQMNTTLEAMAQALFKSWFVDFDPVIDNALAAGNPIPEELAERAERRAKAAQQQSPEHPHTLQAAIRQQFPDRFVFTETMGWVPEGWRLGCFGDLAEHVRANVKAEDIAGNDLYVGLEHIGRKHLFLSEHGLGESVDSNKSKFEKDDLLFGKLRPYFHKVCIAPSDGICSTDILVLRAKTKPLQSYMVLTAYT
nr:restriction endonuclease subunit S [Pseudomonas sp.]